MSDKHSFLNANVFSSLCFCGITKRHYETRTIPASQNPSYFTYTFYSNCTNNPNSKSKQDLTFSDREFHFLLLLLSPVCLFPMPHKDRNCSLGIIILAFKVTLQQNAEQVTHIILVFHIKIKNTSS